MVRVMNDPIKGSRRWCDLEIMGENASSQLKNDLPRHLSASVMRQDPRGSLLLGRGIGMTDYLMTLPKHRNEGGSSGLVASKRGGFATRGESMEEGSL